MGRDVVGWSPAEKETPRQTSDRIIKSMQDNARKAIEQRKKGKR
jgi:hypothetical protein